MTVMPLVVGIDSVRGKFSFEASISFSKTVVHPETLLSPDFISPISFQPYRILHSMVLP